MHACNTGASIGTEDLQAVINDEALAQRSTRGPAGALDLRLNPAKKSDRYAESMMRLLSYMVAYRI